MNNSAVYIDCISGLPTEMSFADDLHTPAVSETAQQLRNEVPRRKEKVEAYKSEAGQLYVGPGLIDLQVNGVNGIDFNNPSLTTQRLKDATLFLLSQGVTTFFPTLITNSETNISSILSIINASCESDSLIDQCIGGIHLEGPFLSGVTGAKGAHDERYLRLPDWQLFAGWQQAAGGRIKLVTVAPELEGAMDFILACRSNGIVVSIGHSMANLNQIQLAVKAGASIATHLGNAVPLTLPRHPNILWDLLATEELYACIIADGLHVPDAFMKVVIKTKGDMTLLVSDATCFAGMAPGEYESPIGGSVIVDHEKRVSLKRTPGLLAGAAKTLLENVETLTSHKLASLGEAWKMGSFNVSNMLVNQGIDYYAHQDYVMFQRDGDTIRIEKVIKNKKIVFGNHNS